MNNSIHTAPKARVSRNGLTHVNVTINQYPHYVRFMRRSTISITTSSKLGLGDGMSLSPATFHHTVLEVAIFLIMLKYA